MANFIGAVPELHLNRSSRRIVQPVQTSWKHGELIPVSTFEVIPGDTFKCDLNALVRMNTPYCPFYGSIECELNAFFVPYRLVWTHWEEFLGANKTQAGAQLTTYTVPKASAFAITGGVAWNSVARYMGVPVTAVDYSKSAYGNFSVLPMRAYFKIWSDFYRASMIQAPAVVEMGDIGSMHVATIGGSPVYPGSGANFRKVNKAFDIFTLSLQSPQYGSNAVTLPLGTKAAVKYDPNYAPTLKIGSSVIAPSIGSEKKLTTYLTGHMVQEGSGSAVGIDPDGSLYTDLSTATAATINQLRYAFATQRYLETMNYGGSQYWSILNAVYGVTPSDKSLQRPQRIGTVNFTLNVSQVTAMADTTISGSVKPAGSTGAISVTGLNQHLFTKAFDEHGVVIVLLHTRVKNQIYTQGMPKFLEHFDRLDFYTPQFANIGDVPVYKRNLFVAGTTVDNDVFGYQEAWYEYKRMTALNTGVLDSNAGAGVAVDIWSLTNKFASSQSLNSSFLEEDRNVVASRLITGTSSNYDYIGEFTFDFTAIRPIPLTSNPAVLDHFIK